MTAPRGERGSGVARHQGIPRRIRGRMRGSEATSNSSVDARISQSRLGESSAPAKCIRQRGERGAAVDQQVLTAGRLDEDRIGRTGVEEGYMQPAVRLSCSNRHTNSVQMKRAARTMDTVRKRKRWRRESSSPPGDARQRSRPAGPRRRARRRQARNHPGTGCRAAGSQRIPPSGWCRRSEAMQSRASRRPNGSRIRLPSTARPPRIITAGWAGRMKGLATKETSEICWK